MISGSTAPFLFLNPVTFASCFCAAKPTVPSFVEDFNSHGSSAVPAKLKIFTIVLSFSLVSSLMTSSFVAFLTGVTSPATQPVTTANVPAHEKCTGFSKNATTTIFSFLEFKAYRRLVLPSANTEPDSLSSNPVQRIPRNNTFSNKKSNVPSISELTTPVPLLFSDVSVSPLDMNSVLPLVAVNSVGSAAVATGK